MIVQELKKEICDLITELGYNITDTGAYVEDFPWLMIRTSGQSRYFTMDLDVNNIKFTIDIFSKYNGEKEVLDIVDNITTHINTLREIDKRIMFIAQTNLMIIDDEKTGPTKKHAILTYSFLTSGPKEEE